MLPTSVETAIPLVFDLEEPLISRDDGEDDHNLNLWFNDEVVNDVFRYFQVVGCILGFMLQCVSLGATAALALHWDDNVPGNSSSGDDGTESSFQNYRHSFLYWTIFGLSHSWLLLFPVVCLAIERSWKESGVCFLQTHVLNLKEPIVTRQTKRMTFVASVRFLIGVVMGCFLTWSLIDFYLGASVVMLSTLLVSMLACLALCQAMIVVYDSFST